VSRDDIQKELAYYKRRVDELAGENLKLDYTISGLRHELKQKRQGFALLSELQPRVGADKQISSIFETTMEAINATLGMDRTVVLAPAEAGNAYRPSHWLGFREDVAEQLTALKLVFPPGVSTGEEVLIVNKATPPTPLVQRIREAFDLPFFICVPVMGADAPIGLLLSGRLKEVKPLYPPLDQGDLDTFQAIAGLISASVRNMRVAVLEEMDRLKTNFFANISHEFRTPITLTLGPLEQILAGRHGELSPESHEQLAIMRRNQERLLGLVNQILDLAKLEAGGMELRATLLENANAFIADRVDQFRALAQKRGVALDASYHPAASEVELFVDHEMLDKVLFNLLSNAVKFTREGRIDVTTEVADGALRLSVADTGIGIKEDQLPHIFDRFRQADGSEAREFAGTGIGLALVQEIVHLHGGTITVYSRYGQGTTFHVTLPLGSAHLDASAIADSDPRTAPSQAAALPDLVIEGGTDREGAGRLNRLTEESFDPARPTIVYAEDNPDLRRFVRDLLRDTCNVYLAVDGRDGVDAARRYRPDLVVTDQMMPNMSGRDLLRAIRSDPELRLTPVIFLTARVGSEARIESLEAGADDYLTKPFHEGELLARVRNLINARRQERELEELNRLLEARVDEQMAELLRTGELRRFLPPAVVESVLRGELAEPGFDRRKITILAAEIGGIAELTEELEPEELSTLVNDYLRELTTAAVAAGGTVDTSAAQRIVALFGAPAALDPADQAWQAVRAALEMRDRMTALTALWRRRGIATAPQLRMAINTGFCTVGVFGSDALRSFGAVGAPLAIATSLPRLAGPGDILCAFPTYALIESRVVATPLGERTLEGSPRPLALYEILGADDPHPAPEAPLPPPVFLPK
jgi:signal transduction histidine kinase/class 3 adenylate cyclase/CheY-like chemotaxis protein